MISRQALDYQRVFTYICLRLQMFSKEILGVDVWQLFTRWMLRQQCQNTVSEFHS